MAAEGMQFPGRWDGGTMSTNLEGIWELSVYYAVRNSVYLSRHVFMGPSSRPIYLINKFAFFVLLAMLAVAYGRFGRWLMIGRAARDGERGRFETVE